MTNVETPWLTLTQAAARSQFSYDTIGQAVRTGELRARQRRRKGPWRVHIEDLDAWLRDAAPPARRPIIRSGS